MRKILLFLGILTALVVAGFVILTLSIDGIVKSSIQEKGSNLLNTRVEVDDVAISLWDGSGSIEGITIQNPEGFADRPAMKLQQIDLQIDLPTLLSDTVVVHEVIIKKPELYFEQKVSGNNLSALTQNLTPSPSDGTNLVVERLLVEKGLVMASTDIGGEQRSAQAEFEQFEITGIGRKGNNTVEQTLKQILEPILKRAAREAVEEGLLEKAKQKLKDLLDGS